MIMRNLFADFVDWRTLSIMDRITGILFFDPTKKSQKFKCPHTVERNELRQVGRDIDVYFNADADSQLAVTRLDKSSGKCQQIAWSGTIHNRNEIVRYLNQSGISVEKNISDAQLILKLYHIVGCEAPTYIIGYFAFAIWDEFSKKLFLSRDALGGKCIHYLYDRNFLCWGTEIRQICYLAEKEPILNEKWMAEALTWPWDGCLTHTIDSPIKNVQAIPPGHSMLLNYGKKPKIIPWWEWKIYRDEVCFNEDNLIEEFRSLLVSSVKRCLGHNNKIIADLSGGLDSSSIVSVACYLAEKGESNVNLKNVFSLYDPTEPQFDETRYQEAVVKRYELNWHKLPLESCWYLSGICDQNTYFDYPTPTLLWLKFSENQFNYMAENGFVMSLTGNGGDNIMPQTSVYLFDYIRSGKVKSVWKDIVLFSQKDNKSLWKIIVDEILSPIKHLPHLWHPQIPTWLNKDFLRKTDLKTRLYDRHHDLKKYPLSSQLDAIAIKWNLDRIFTVGQYVASPSGIDLRHPFMDRRVINFALQLPPALKRQPKQSKYILRQAMKGILPETVRLRKGKTAFSHLRHQGMVNEAPYLHDMITNPILAQLGFIDMNSWKEEMTKYKLGIISTWKHLRPAVQFDSPLAVEVWLRTCFPQLRS